MIRSTSAGKCNAALQSKGLIKLHKEVFRDENTCQFVGPKIRSIQAFYSVKYFGNRLLRYCHNNCCKPRHWPTHSEMHKAWPFRIPTLGAHNLA